jgi:lysophospholipase L1-like esterase
MTVSVPRNGRVLFIGDSITDCNRDRADGASLGSGYAYIAAARFLAEHPNHGVTFLNRGIGGDRVCDLRARWEPDCLKLEPGLVSIMIGINDTWRRFDSGEATSTADYERDYRDILTLARDRLGADLLLMEPFVVPVDEAQWAWREDLDPRIAVVRRLAAEFGATLLATDGLFAEAAAASAPADWAYDGVHLTPAGNALLADAWLRLVQPSA